MAISTASPLTSWRCPDETLSYAQQGSASIARVVPASRNLAVGVQSKARARDATPYYKRIAISLLLITVIPTAVAAQTTMPDEVTFLRQSKTCEAATRLPGGDVDNTIWVDCMRNRAVRTLEESFRSNRVRTPWSDAVDESLLFATAEGCEAWSEKQPEDPPRRGKRWIWRHNHAWNLCMEQHGIFAVPQGRKFPDYQAIVAEQRTVTIMDPSTAIPIGLWHHFGCHTERRYDELLTAALNSFQPLSEAHSHREEWRQKQRELFTTIKDCRLWNDGDRVQVKAAIRKQLCLGVGPPCPVYNLLCLAPIGSTDHPCYWSGREIHRCLGIICPRQCRRSRRIRGAVFALPARLLARIVDDQTQTPMLARTWLQAAVRADFVGSGTAAKDICLLALPLELSATVETALPVGFRQQPRPPPVRCP